MPSVKPSLRVEKSFGFKGGTQLWSNRYHFNGGTPADSTAWHALMDAVVNLEKTVFTGRVQIVRCVGYAAGSDVPVTSKNYSTAGTLSSSGSDCPGEVAALVRYATAARSTKNHPIYGFSFYHGAVRQAITGHEDELESAQGNALSVYANGWISGITAGGITATRTTAGGHAATAALVEEYLTHRDFPPSSSV